MISGPVIVAAGFLLAVRIGSDTSYWLGVFPAMVMIALGMAGAVAPLTTAVLMRRRRFPNASLADDRNESLRAKARWGARALC